jgi:hypothetical protein
VNCSACRDPLHSTGAVMGQDVMGHAVTGRAGRYCKTCFEELEHGVIRNQNIALHGGSRGRLDEDMGSYRTNAVRNMEDGGVQ